LDLPVKENLLLFLQKFRPVAVSFFDISRSVLVPGFLDFPVEIQIEFAINYRPGFRVYIRRGPTAYGIGSVAAILRGKFLRGLPEHGKVLLAAEEPLGVVPFVLIFIPAFYRPAKREVGDRVVTLQGDAFSVNIDRSRRGRAGRQGNK